MRGNELLDKLERIDPTYIEAADTGFGCCARFHVRFVRMDTT